MRDKVKSQIVAHVIELQRLGFNVSVSQVEQIFYNLYVLYRLTHPNAKGEECRLLALNQIHQLMNQITAHKGKAHVRTG